MCLAQRHNTVTLVRLEPVGPLSWVKHSTTEPHCSRWVIWHAFCCLLISTKITFSKNSFRNDISVNQFGPRSGPTKCWAWSGSKVFAKFINRRTTQAGKELTFNAPIATKVVCFSRLLKCLRNLYGKQCGPRPDCSYRSSLFWVHAVCVYT